MKINNSQGDLTDIFRLKKKHCVGPMYPNIILYNFENKNTASTISSVVHIDGRNGEWFTCVNYRYHSVVAPKWSLTPFSSSVAILADVLVRSPQTLIMFIIRQKMGQKYPENILFLFGGKITRAFVFKIELIYLGILWSCKCYLYKHINNFQGDLTDVSATT